MSLPRSLLVPSRSSSHFQSNLERFLQCVTPLPPCSFHPQSCIDEPKSLLQRPGNKEVVEYFTLDDLWNCYDEWSAYGTGTEVLTNTGDNILQYYVPYLSAIQLFCNKSIVASRRPSARYYSDTGDSELDSSSDDSMSDKLSRCLSNNSSRTWDSIFEDLSFDHDGSSLPRDRLGYPYLQYFEISSPYWRVPLVEKINELAETYPGLKMLNNVDLSPASWMAVAWYPIYHIPSRSNEKDLSTCFLTYHTLSSCFKDCNCQDNDILGSFNTKGGNQLKHKAGTSLRPFGLVTHKMHGDIWVNPDTFDHERLVYLHSAADSWLKQLNVHHHDFNFFTYHSTL